MPQLDTTPWLMVSVSTLITLFIVFQLKLKTFHYHLNPNFHSMKKFNYHLPWEEKWTKTYLPLSLSHLT